MGFLHETEHAGALLVDQASDLATPASGRIKIYPKSGELYKRNSAGAVVQFAVSTNGMADAVILAPGSSTRNVIQSSGNFKALIVKNNAAQAVAKVEWQASDGTMQGAITASGDIVRSGAAGTNRIIEFQTAGSTRWNVYVDGVAESGSEAGSDFYISRYNDSGSLIENAFQIIRATGAYNMYAKTNATNTVTNTVNQFMRSTGTPAVGFGVGHSFQGHSANNTDREMGRIRYLWAEATDATRKARCTLSVNDTAQRDAISIQASGSAPQIGVFSQTGSPVVQPSTTGETAGFTAGAGTNVTDQSTFTGNVGSTAYRISDIVKALKNVGWLAQ